MNRLAEARSLIAGLLDGVLPGRAGPYRPTRLSAPYLWIGAPTVSARPPGIVATFPVHCLAAGADHGALALLDELVSHVWDACEATKGVTPSLASERRPPDDAPAGSVLSVVEVAVNVAARTFCTEQPTAATVPTTPVEV